MTAAVLMAGGGAITLGFAGTIQVSSTTGNPQVDFNADGTITYTSNGVAGLFYERGWYQSANFGTEVDGIGERYEIRLTADPGDFALELLNTWVDLDTGTSWQRNSGLGTSEGFIEIRDANTQVVLALCLLRLVDQ